MEVKANEMVKNFLEQCRNDLTRMKEEVKISIEQNENVNFYCYKYTMCDEIFDLFKTNQGGVGYYTRLYKDEEYPLDKIFSDFLDNFTEPKLMTENKLYKLLDKIEK